MSGANKELECVRTGGLLSVLRIALPLILSNSCHAINMFVDRLMLARHSSEAVAASFTAGLTHFCLSCLCVGLIGYTGTFVAQYEGAGRRDRIGRVVWQGIYLSCISALCMASGIFWAEPLFQSFRHDPSVTAQEVVYFVVLCKGGIVFLLGSALSCFWTGRGKTALVLTISIAITLCNLPLNYVLIFGKCGLPALGAEGAAWGTVLSELIGLLVYLGFFFAPSARKHFMTQNFRLDLPLLGRMIRFGLPNGFHLLLDLVAFNTFALLMGCYGGAVHEATSIAFGVNNIAFCPVMGIGMTAAILVGQAIGAEEIPLARKSVRNCFVLIMGYSLLMVVLFTCFQQVVLAPFIRPGDAAQAEAIRCAGIMLKLISAYLVFDGINITVTNVLRGAGDTRFPMFVMLFAGLFMLVPACLILFRTGQSWLALWAALIVYCIGLSVVFALRYKSGKWTKMRVIEERAVNKQ